MNPVNNIKKRICWKRSSSECTIFPRLIELAYH
jgi:hypothetical protein